MGESDRCGELMALLMRYEVADRQQHECRNRFLEFVRTTSQCFERSHLAGHLTASGCVTDSEISAVLLMHHVKLGLWLQPGGHADGDHDLIGVARREVEEETGVSSLALLHNGIFDLDVHAIPARGDVPEHLHYDVRFLFQAPTSAVIRSNHESHGVQWLTPDQVTKLETDESVRRMVRKWEHWRRLHSARS